MTVTFDAPAAAGRPGRRVALYLAFLSVVGLVGVLVVSIVNKPKPESGTLYFTTFASQSLYRVGFDYSGARPSFASPQLVTKLPAADGLTFEPDGHALVGGQGTGYVYEVDPSSGSQSKVASGCPGAFLLALAPSGRTVYTAGLPADLCAMPTDPLGAGQKLAVHGDDTQVTDLAFDENGTCFYTTGGSGGTGNFGVLNLATGATTRELSGIPSGHGMAFDPFTRTLFLFGGTGIDQIDPKSPKQILSSMSVTGTQFDNGTTDGRGHLYVASNFGQLVVVDYHASGRLGDTRNVVTELHLKNYLDDVAPLVGPGAASPTAREAVDYGLIFFGLLLVLSLFYRYAPSARLTSRLPTWDIRRQELDARRRNATRIRQRQERRPPRGPGW